MGRLWSDLGPIKMSIFLQIVQKSWLLEIFLLLFDSPATCPATFNALFRDISCNILSILISDISQNIFLKKIQAKCSIMFLYSPLPVDFVLKLEEGPPVFPYGALIYSTCRSQKTLFFFFFQKPNNNFPFFATTLTQIIEPVLGPRLVALHLRTDRVHSPFYLSVWIATFVFIIRKSTISPYILHLLLNTCIWALIVT